MPPKAKFTKQEIADAALQIIRENGIDALTARALGAKMGTSPRPIFTVYVNMDEVEDAAVQAAKTLYTNEYVGRGLQETPAFKGVGKAYIRFALEEPKLFALLFMRETDVTVDISTILGVIEGSFANILQSIIDEYGLDSIAAHKLYQHLWIYTHGIAVLVATKVCTFTAEEISDMLTEAFRGILLSVKGGIKL